MHSQVVEIEADIGALQPSVANGTPTRLSTTKAKLQNDCITAANEGMYSCVGENNLAEQVQHTSVKVGKDKSNNIETACLLLEEKQAS